MEHIILSVHTSTNWKLRVRFLEGVTKEYSCKPLFLHSPLFSQLAANEESFTCLPPKTDGSCAYWNDYLGISADDIWDKNKLEKQLKFMKEKNCAFSFTGYEFANEQAIRNGKVVHVPNEISYKEALKNTTISTITVMFDRGKIPTNLLLMPENCTREDTATWWKILKHGYIAYGLDEALSVYRRHSNSYSSNKWKAVLGTWNMYRVQEQMSVVTSARYLFFNLWNAVKRRV